MPNPKQKKKAMAQQKSKLKTGRIAAMGDLLAWAPADSDVLTPAQITKFLVEHPQHKEVMDPPNGTVPGHAVCDVVSGFIRAPLKGLPPGADTYTILPDARERFSVEHTPTCYKCGEKGHTMEDCLAPEQTEAGTQALEAYHRFIAERKAKEVERKAKAAAKTAVKEAATAVEKALGKAKPEQASALRDLLGWATVDDLGWAEWAAFMDAYPQHVEVVASGHGRTFCKAIAPLVVFNGNADTHKSGQSNTYTIRAGAREAKAMLESKEAAAAASAGVPAARQIAEKFLARIKNPNYDGFAETSSKAKVEAICDLLKWAPADVLTWEQWREFAVLHPQHQAVMEHRHGQELCDAFCWGIIRFKGCADEGESGEGNTYTIDPIAKGLLTAEAIERAHKSRTKKMAEKVKAKCPTCNQRPGAQKCKKKQCKECCTLGRACKQPSHKSYVADGGDGAE